MANFNDEHAASIGYVNDAVVEAFEKMQIWVTTHADQLEYVQHIGTILNSANRISTDSRTVTERAQAVLASINAIVQAMISAGVDMQGVTTSEIAQYINGIASNSGIWIEDANGQRWTAASWAAAKEQAGGVDPAPFQGILLMNSDHEFYVASRNYGPMQWGTYNHTVPNMQSGTITSPMDGERNARKLLAATDPDKLRPWGWAIDYFEGMKRTDVLGKDCIFFPNQATLTAWATDLGLYEMLAIGSSVIYAIPHADEGYWVLKYFNGSTSISFGNREAVAPYTDNYGQIGSTIMECCVTHKENQDDPLFWRGPSLYECLMMCMNRNAINACRSALGQTVLPSGAVWTVIQYSNNSAYYFGLADGSCTYSNKNNNYNVVPVASRHISA